MQTHTQHVTITVFNTSGKRYIKLEYTTQKEKNPAVTDYVFLSLMWSIRFYHVSSLPVSSAVNFCPLNYSEAKIQTINSAAVEGDEILNLHIFLCSPFGESYYFCSIYTMKRNNKMLIAFSLVVLKQN